MRPKSCATNFISATTSFFATCSGPHSSAHRPTLLGVSGPHSCPRRTQIVCDRDQFLLPRARPVARRPTLFATGGKRNDRFLACRTIIQNLPGNLVNKLVQSFSVKKHCPQTTFLPLLAVTTRGGLRCSSARPVFPPTTAPALATPSLYLAPLHRIISSGKIPWP